MLSLSLYSANEAALRQIASRVFATLQCNHHTEISPPFLLPMPEGFTGTWGPRLDDVSVLASWGMSADRAVMMQRHALSPHAIIESESRTIYEQVDGDERRIAATWRCFTLDIDIAFFHSGPIAEDEKRLLAALDGAHCPN